MIRVLIVPLLAILHCSKVLAIDRGIADKVSFSKAVPASELFYNTAFCGANVHANVPWCRCTVV